jgi:hypothetical protein
MPVRVSPTEPNPTHHVALRDRKGQRVGLVLCDANGRITPNYSMNPVERTAMKTSTGNSTYSDFEYPYSPITQDDWSGGRGGLDFERDSTKFFDSMRLRTGKANKAFLGPQEQWGTGYQNQDVKVPGNVTFFKLNDQYYVAKRFTASASYTAGLAWMIMRKRGSPADLTVAIYSDATGAIDAELSHIHVASTRLTDILSEWLNETISQALTSGTAYWIVVYAASTDNTKNHWEIGVSAGLGTTYSSASGGAWANWSAASFDLYFRLTPANSDKSAIFFEYKEQQYVVLSPPSGAPTLLMFGDRGAADANTGQLTKLIDATKTWTANDWAGCVVMVTDGLGKTETQTWRTIVSNTGTELVVDTPWIITHDTTTEYVILGAKTREITGHGLTGPVTNVLVSTTGVVYFAMGALILIRRHREYNNAGTWMESTAAEWADESAASYADFLTYKPQAQLIFRAQNYDVNQDVSVSSATVPVWGTALSWSATPTKVGSKYRKVTRLECYPDNAGNESIYAFKTDIPWVVPTSGNPYPLSLREMETIRSKENGSTVLVHGVYLYFSLKNSLERYYGGNVDDVGPNIGEAMPAERQGPMVALIGYPGRFFAAVDASATGYSSLIERDGNGWHERYRAPKGQRILALGFQVIPGTALDRLWIYQGNDFIWLPFPSSLNELEDSNYRFTHEAALTLSRMHAGMMDVQKLVKIIKLWTDQLDPDVCWIEMDYRLNSDEEWSTFEDMFEASPQARIDLTSIFGMAGKRIQLRLRFYTSDASKTPILLAAIVEAVIRVTVKYMYPIAFRLMDNEETLAGREADDIPDGLEKLQILKDWADDASDSMLFVESQSRLWHGKMVFLNPPDVRQVKVNTNPESEKSRDVYVCSTTMQDA